MLKFDTAQGNNILQHKIINVLELYLEKLEILTERQRDVIIDTIISLNTPGLEIKIPEIKPFGDVKKIRGK